METTLLSILSHRQLTEALQLGYMRAHEDITGLTRDLASRGSKNSRGGDRGSELAFKALASEKEQLERQFDKTAQQFSKVKDDYDTLQADYKKLERDNKELLESNRLLTETTDSLKKEVGEMRDTHKQSKQRSDGLNKDRSAAMEESRREHLRNEVLSEENSKLVAENKSLQEERDVSLHVIAEIEAERDKLEQVRDNFDIVKEDLISEKNRLESQLQETKEKYYAAMDDSEHKEQLEALTNQLKGIQEKSREQASQDKRQIELLKDRVQKLVSETDAGRKQKEIETLLKDQEALTEMVAHLKQSHDEAISDKAKLADKLISLEEQMDQRVAEKIIQQRDKFRDLERDYKTLQNRLQEDNGRTKDLERVNAELSHEVDQLKYWNDKYIKGKAYESLSRQIQISNDNIKRLNREVEDRTALLSKVQDSNGLLKQAYDRLKREAGKDPDFSYPKEELQEEIECETARLEMQQRELEDQRSSLESENTRLRKQITSLAGNFAKDGFRFAGLRPDQVAKVAEFANNLRDGKVELPMDDRAVEALKENRRLKEENEELLERIKFGGDSADYKPRATASAASTGAAEETTSSAGAASGPANGTGGLSRMQEAEMSRLGEDMKKLLLENAELRSRMVTMQDEVISLIRSQASTHADHSESMTNIMQSHNEGMIAELKNLRSMQSTGVMAGTVGMSPEMQAQMQKMTQMQQQMFQEQQRMSQERAKETPGAVHGKHKKAHTKTHGKIPLVHTTPGPAAAETSGFPPVATPAQTANLGVTFAPMHTPYGQTPGFGGTEVQFTGPNTPAGKTLLSKSLQQMNLPSEDWVEDVKDLNGQLVEALEQLHERELEVTEQHSLIAGLEENLVSIKQQMAALYHDYAQRSESWETQTKDFTHNNKMLSDERDDLKLKLQRMQDVLNHVKKEDPDSLEARLVEATRKVAVYEINEAVLSRKFISQTEILDAEKEKSNKYEQEFVEMETSLKQRILYLEQYKQAAGSRVAYLQGKLDSSIPSADYTSLQKELDSLREDHLAVLRREVDARVSALRSKEQSNSLRTQRLNNALMASELAGVQATAVNLSAQLENQKEITNRAIQAKGNADLNSFVSDIAVFRGEVGRLEVELAAASRRSDALSEELRIVSNEAEQYAGRILDLENVVEESTIREEDMRKSCLAMALKYTNGMDREDTEALQKKMEKLSSQLEDSQMEAGKYKEMAEIASKQAQTIGQFHSSNTEEVRALREHINQLESRSDDDILIGRLQRQLMTMKSSYKQFVQKYQMLRGGMRQREINARLLEARLDQRDEAISNMQEAHLLETSALKKALRNVKNMTEDDPTLVSSPKKGKKSDKGPVNVGVGYVKMGDKLMRMSSRVKELSEMAEESLEKAKQAEDESTALEGEVQDLTAQVDILNGRCKDLEMTLEKGSKQKTQNIAARLVSLSEEVRTNKLSCLQQRRQIQVLRQEKRHLQNLLQQTEADVESLEVGKVFSETKGLLDNIEESDGASVRASHHQDISKPQQSNMDVSLDTSDVASAPAQPADKTKATRFKPELTIDTGAGPAEEYVQKIEALNEELSTARREASNNRLQADKFRSQTDEMEAVLKEMQSQISYYERMAQQEGLPQMRSGASSMPPGMNTKQYRAMQEKQSELQEAAGVTIGSLKQLLQEKNRVIDSLNDRLREAQSSSSTTRRQSKADRKAELLLERLEVDEKSNKHHALTANNSGVDSELHNKLLNQLEQADDIMQKKDEEIRKIRGDLEEQRNLAELRKVRAGAAKEEIDLMKDDMMKLAQQLQLSEDRLRRASGKSVTAASSSAAVSGMIQMDERKINDLKSKLKAKDEKLKGYYDIIVRLKEEFIKAEEQQALAALQGNKGQSGASTNNADEFKDLRNQIGALRDGLRQAKDDLEKARRVREKLADARAAAEEEARRFEAQIGASEANAATAQQALNKTRKELEDSRRKEYRLREKLKELLETEGGADKVKDLKAANERAETAEKEVELLRAQNLALRKAAEEVNTSSVGLKRSAAAMSQEGVTETNPAAHSNARSSALSAQENTSTFGGIGNTLGGDSAPQDELRAQLHTKWESEKKLQKRLTVVERRLHEKLGEIDDLTNQLKRARDTATAAIAAKDDAIKKARAANASEGTKRGSDKSHPSTAHGHAQDPESIEGANSRVFALEEEVNKLKRKAEVEQMNEIAKLRHQLSVSTVRVGELESELEESERRRKQAASGQGKTLRDSEDRFLREERLKDDLDIARRQKLELEAAMLDRDARAIETRFDLESREQDADRLRRRIKELESAYRSVAAQAGQTTHPTSGAKSVSASGKRADREADLEGTVEAMRRVVEKLKAENERLRKGNGSDDRKAADADKKLREEKQRAAKLDEENAGLKAKLKGHEESSQKLIQRQQQLASLRKQLKSRDEEIAHMKETSGGAMEEVDSLKKKLKTYQDRIAQLEETAATAAARGSSASGNNERLEKEVVDLRRRAQQQNRELDSLRAELQEAQRSDMKAGQTYPARPGGDSGPVNNAELKRLRDENEKLRQELAAFDMDFFEEIENLKYAHAEAVKKLRAYEAADSRGGRHY